MPRGGGFQEKSLLLLPIAEGFSYLPVQRGAVALKRLDIGVPVHLVDLRGGTSREGVQSEEG